MSNLQKIIVKDAETATHKATGLLRNFLETESKSRKPVLILLSGGSSLELLKDVDQTSPNTTITVLDERYSKEPGENNFAQITKLEFYKNAKARGSLFIDTRVRNNETMEQLAERFNKSLLEWIKKNPSGTIIATAGMGSDGHTSGIMPFPEHPDKFRNLFDDGNSKNFVAAYDATGKNQYPLRVTTTLNFIRKINYTILFVVGENKREALERVLRDEGTLSETPARIWNEIEGEVHLYTDINI